MDYIRGMTDVRRTAEFAAWLDGLKDVGAVVHIARRIDRLAAGNPGDVKGTSEPGIYEMRIDYGPGYRVYFARIGHVTVLLLIGGDKRTQSRDITRAARILKQWEG